MRLQFLTDSLVESPMTAVTPIPLRAKEQLPMVLLTLLSIVQALALELLWAHLVSHDYLYQWTWIAFLCWVQIGATLLGVLLIWLIYTSISMRFRWIPTPTDSVFPFFIGLIEFTLIVGLGPERFAWWFFDLALIFAVMAWVSQITLRRARLDGDNDAYFASVTPAMRRDFYPIAATVSGLAAMGVYLGVSGDRGWVAFGGLIGAIGVLGFQLHLNTVYWRRSMAP
jgi:hypothetical protein